MQKAVLSMTQKIKCQFLKVFQKGNTLNASTSLSIKVNRLVTLFERRNQHFNFSALLSRLVLGIILTCSFLQMGLAQVAAHAQLDTAEIMIGDQIGLTLFINHPPSAEIDRIDWAPLDEVKEIEVLDYGSLNTVAEGNEILLEQKLTITSFDSGYYFIPKIPVYYKNNGTTGVAKSDQLALLVNTIDAQSDSTQIAPIKDIVREPLKFVDFIPYLSGMVLLALLISLFLYFKNRKNREEAPPQPEIILPPHEVALNKLEDLKKAKLWQQGEIKAFQSELTFIIREYLENRFNVPALESTTNEIARLFKTIQLDEEWTNKLLSIFRTADMVKFAKAIPDIKVHNEGLEEAERFVIHTKKRSAETATSETEEETEEEVNEPDNNDQQEEPTENENRED